MLLDPCQSIDRIVTKNDTFYTNTKMGYEEKLQTAFFIQAGLTTRTVTK